MRRRQWLMGALASALATLVSTPARATQPMTQAPLFNLKGADGNTVALADFRHRVVIVDFWATWCGPCRIQIPVLNKFAASNPKIAVLGVCVDRDGPSVLPSFVARTPINYPVLYGSEALAVQYGAPGFPALAIVAADGRLARLHVGLLRDSHALGQWVSHAKAA